MARLDQICSLNMGQSPDSSSYNENGEGMPFFQGNADFGKVHPRVRVWCSAPTKVAHTGDVLISVRAPIGALNIADRECCIGRGLAALTVNEELCNKDYLWYAIASKVEELNSKGTGSTFKAISKSVLAETEIPLPTLGEQQGVARQLAKVDELIALRKEQLAKLDQLVKSRFIELFGVCDTYELLKDSNIYISDGNYSSKYPTADEFVEEGIPFIRASNMEMNTIVDNNMYFITKEKHAILLKGHVKAGDVLITTRGATIGKIACVPPRHEDSNINAQIVLLRCPKKEYNPLFLSWYLKLDNTQAEIQKLISGSAQPQLPIKRLVQLNLLKPDINLQNQFVAFVEQIDKSKLAIQQSLDKLELLKKSLMQEYFG